MAFVRKPEAGPYSLSPQNNTVNNYDYNGPVKGQDRSNTSISDPQALINTAKDLANSSNGRYTEDEAKYVIATKTAKDRFKDVADVDDNRMKQEIDNIYENELQASNTGKEVRGENWFTDFIGGMKDLYNDGLNIVGSGLDAMFDTAVSPIGFFNEDLKNTLQGMFDGEDLSIVPDILADVGLAAIPYAGIPLVAAKNAWQRADDIAEAITGRDNITQEDLEGTQRLGKIGESLASVGLAAVPGIGKAKNLVKRKGAINDQMQAVKDVIAESGETPGSIVGKALVNSDDVSKVKGLLPEGTESISPNALGFVDDASRGTKDTIAALKESYPKAIGHDAEKVMEEINGPKYRERFRQKRDSAKELLSKNHEKEDEILDSIDKLKLDKSGKTKTEKNKIKTEINDLKSQRDQYRRHPILATREFMEGILPQGKTTKWAKQQEAFDALRNPAKSPSINVDAGNNKTLQRMNKWFQKHPLLSQGTNYGINGAMLGGAAISNEMAETGVDPLTALAQSSQRVVMDPSAFAAMLVPMGARGIARKYAPNASGKYQSDLGYQSLRAGAVSDELARMSEYDVNEGYDEEELFSKLRTAIDRNNNG